MRFVIGLGLPLLILAIGCERKAPQGQDKPPPTVNYVHPRVQKVTEYEEFTGRTEAVRSVEIRARVTGYLNKAPFAEGTDVKKGDLLFEIDPRTYAAELDRMNAQLRQNQATLERLGQDYQRARNLLSNRAISREEVDKITGNRLEAEAAVGAARAAVKSAELNVGFTTIEAPFSGRISRRFCDPGNLVKADDTILTTLVQLDPIHAYFDIDERTVLKLRRLMKDKKYESLRGKKDALELRLADSDPSLQHEEDRLFGTLDFRDNHLDPGTGTLRIRVKVDNKDGLLAPGMFVRLRLPVSNEQELPLVPEEAISSDMNKKLIYVLNEENEAIPVPVTVGQQVPIGPVRARWRSITSAEFPKGNGGTGKPQAKRTLTASDRVITEGQLNIPRGDNKKVTPSLDRQATPTGDGQAVAGKTAR